MRDFLIIALMAVCFISLTALCVAVFWARIGAMEWWLGNEDAEDRPGGRFAFIRSSWFFYIVGGLFAGTALTLMSLFD